MEKKEKRKKRFLFIRISLFAGSDFWKRGAGAKQDLGTAVITHSLPSLRIGTNFSKRRVFKATKSIALPFALDQRHALMRSASSKMTSQASR